MIRHVIVLIDVTNSEANGRVNQLMFQLLIYVVLFDI